MRKTICSLILTAMLSMSAASEIPPNYSVSYHSVPGATGQLDTFLKWVLKENNKIEGTFFVSRLELKGQCKPLVTRAIDRNEDEKLRRLYEDQLELNMDCLTEQPYILWSEGNQLFKPVFISWRLKDTLPEGASLHEAIRMYIPPHNFVDLNEGVVPTEKDINGSTFLVTRAWVHKRMRAALNGDEQVVKLYGAEE